MAVVCGVVWGVVMVFVPVFFLTLLLAAGVGYVIGEVIGRSVNRKRGKGLAIIAGVAVVISYLITNLFWGVPFHLFDLLSIALGIFVAVTRLR